jgi:hypothetical protein
MNRYMTVSMFMVANLAFAIVNHSAHAAGPVVVPKPAIPAVKPNFQPPVHLSAIPAPPKNQSASPRENFYVYKDGSTAHTFIRNDGRFGVTLHSNPDGENDKIEHFVVDPKTGFTVPGTAPSGK